ncbi:uncharacterized protein PG986_012268 [Apiospora aurea]|uniref:Uncharacterized protein n=1 Tax=Apiospora aurea TaxID=335848 RepID=A0ABR1PZJ7_9PEZI
MSYFIHRIRLVELCQEAVDTLPSIVLESQTTKYDMVLSLHAKFQKFFQQLPINFRPDAASIQQSQDICRDRPPEMLLLSQDLHPFGSNRAGATAIMMPKWASALPLLPRYSAGLPGGRHPRHRRLVRQKFAAGRRGNSAAETAATIRAEASMAVPGLAATDVSPRGSSRMSALENRINIEEGPAEFGSSRSLDSL